MPHSIFERAVRYQLILINPCEHTELPKIIVRRTRTLTPDGSGRLIAAMPKRHRLLVATAIETGMRWGELIALRPRHIDFLRRTVTVEVTIVEVSRKHSGTGERMIIEPYPKDDESRTFGVRSAWLDEVARHIGVHAIGRDELLFSTEVGTPISRNTFRTRGGCRLRVVAVADAGDHEPFAVASKPRTTTADTNVILRSYATSYTIPEKRPFWAPW
jgi:integrase